MTWIVLGYEKKTASLVLIKLLTGWTIRHWRPSIISYVFFLCSKDAIFQTQRIAYLIEQLNSIHGCTEERNMWFLKGEFWGFAYFIESHVDEVLALLNYRLEILTVPCKTVAVPVYTDFQVHLQIDLWIGFMCMNYCIIYLFIWDLGPNFASQTRKAGMSSFSLWRQWQAAHIIYYCIIYYYYTIRIIGFLLYNNNNSYYYCHCIIFSALIYRLLLD